MPLIGIGNWFGKSVGGTWTPKNIESKVLFWGLYSEISGGHMPNKVTGATDYLTVSGSAGSETYQCPNTQSYINADADGGLDYIWFKNNAAQRTPTFAEAIGYDFTRTFFWYDDASPYHIDGVIILKAGQTLTPAESNRVRTYCHLSVWYDGTLSLYGNVKGNRGIGKSTWTPEATDTPIPASALVAQATPTHVDITFNNNLNESIVPATTAFALAGKTISAVSISAKVVTLTVTVAYTLGDVITVNYTKPGSNPITNATDALTADSFSTFSVTNNITYPLIITGDGHTVAWYKPTEAGNVTAASGVESIWWDMMYGKEGALGSEQNSGNIVLFAVYKITACQANFFYTGCAINDVFVCGTVKTCDANNKVQKFTGNHATQYTVVNRPTNQIFTPANGDFLRTAPFTYSQPEFIYIVCKQITWTLYGNMFDGNTNALGEVSQQATTHRLLAYAGSVSAQSNDLALDTWGIVRVLFYGANSKFIIDANTPITGNFGASNMGAITIASAANGTSPGNFQYKELIFRNSSDSADDEANIYKYLKAKYSL